MRTISKVQLSYHSWLDTQTAHEISERHWMEQAVSGYVVVVLLHWCMLYVALQVFCLVESSSNHITPK
jgi:hypothetical protein